MFFFPHRNSSGFTLLEMLIAMAIFAMLGLAANAVLQTVITNDDVTQTFAEKLKGLQQGFGALERDLNQMVARTPRSLEEGRGKTVFQTGSDILDSEMDALVFYRLGWLNPEGLLPRGSLQSVAYVVQEGNLERWYYHYPEPEFGSEPIKTVLMRDVISVEYAFYMEDRWENTVQATKLPKAVAIKVELEEIGKIERKFLLPESSIITADDSSDDTNSNSSDDKIDDQQSGDSDEKAQE